MSSTLIDLNWRTSTDLRRYFKSARYDPLFQHLDHKLVCEEQSSHSSSDRWHQLRQMMESIHDLSIKDSSRIKKTPILLLHHDFWLEALDRQHRYGSHLRVFYNRWKQENVWRQDNCSFFYWLDHGNGKNIEVPECSRHALITTQVQYCTEEERNQYRVSIQSNTQPQLVYTLTHHLVHTDHLSKWIFVLDRHEQLFIGRKQKGTFHHSSFLGGTPISAAGKIWVNHGCIVAIEPHSGHFKPTLKHLMTFCMVLKQSGVNLDTISFIKPKKWKDEWPFRIHHEIDEMEIIHSDCEDL